MSKLTLLCVGLLMTLTLSGCMSSPGGVAPSTVPITAKDSYTVIRRNVSGTDSNVLFFGIPLSPAPSAYDALQDAKSSYNADALINVTAENHYNFCFLLLIFQTMEVNGDAIKFQRNGEELE